MLYKVESAIIDKKNKNVLNIHFSDGTRTTCCIPPTRGNRVDIITQNDLGEGYNLGIECIIIVIKNGRKKVILSNND